jgi:hypothetical protein
VALSSRNRRRILFVSISALFLSGVLLLEPAALPSSLHSSSAYQISTEYPQIQNFAVNISQGESLTIDVPVNNLGSSFNWTSLHLDFPQPPSGVKISQDPFLFEEGFIQAHSDNYSLRIGISIGSNVSIGSYTIPFTLSGHSSLSPPFKTTLINFNGTITVSKQRMEQFPILFVYLAVILSSSLFSIGVILVWSKKWNLTEIKK